jgi:hypothetical protein
MTCKTIFGAGAPTAAPTCGICNYQDPTTGYTWNWNGLGWIQVTAPGGGGIGPITAATADAILNAVDCPTLLAKLNACGALNSSSGNVPPTTPPSAGSPSPFYYNAANSHLYYWTGSAWVDVTGSGGVGGSQWTVAAIQSSLSADANGNPNATLDALLAAIDAATPVIEKYYPAGTGLVSKIYEGSYSTSKYVTFPELSFTAPSAGIYQIITGVYVDSIIGGVNSPVNLGIGYKINGNVTGQFSDREEQYLFAELMLTAVRRMNAGDVYLPGVDVYDLPGGVQNGTGVTIAAYNGTEAVSYTLARKQW